MKKRGLALNAQTMAELTIVFIIVGIVASVTIGVTRAKSEMAKEYSTYAAFKNLGKAVGVMMSNGYLDTSTTPSTLVKGLPDVLHNTGNTGLCDQMINMLNTVGEIYCTNTHTVSAITPDFNATDPNFITSNGARYWFSDLAPTAPADPADPLDPQMFSIFVDVDGTKGNTKFDDDIMHFIITRSGKVLPAPGTKAAENHKYISASVRYNIVDASSLPKTSTTVWPLRDVTYRQAVCESGQVRTDFTFNSSAYCNGITINGSCCNDLVACNSSKYRCQTVLNPPLMINAASNTN